MTNIASNLPLASSLSSRPSCERHVRHVVSLSSVDTSVTVASECGLFPHASSPVSAVMDRVHGQRKVRTAPPGYADCAAAIVSRLRANGPGPVKPATTVGMCGGEVGGMGGSLHG